MAPWVNLSCFWNTYEMSSLIHVIRRRLLEPDCHFLSCDTLYWCRMLPTLSVYKFSGKLEHTHYNLVINQLDTQNFCFTISLFHASTCFEHHVLIIRRSELYYTASGIITPIGGRSVHRLWEDSQPVHETAIYRCDDTRGCIIQFWHPDDEYMCLKHVEAWNKLFVKQKFCASSWLIKKINILRCTVSKT